MDRQTNRCVAYIPVSDTCLAVVDLDDVPKLLDVNTRWCVSGPGYAHARLSKKGNVLMHKVVCGAALVDHKNGDVLDNRSDNLRPSDKQRNALNRPRDSNNTSGYKGVSFHKPTGKWRASLYIGEAIHLGLYATAIEAAKAYDKAMFEWAGPYGAYNFPEELP